MTSKHRKYKETEFDEKGNPILKDIEFDDLGRPILKRKKEFWEF